MTNYIVADCEGDSLTPTKIWCLSYNEGGETKTLTSYGEIRSFLTRTDMTLVMHNGLLWDIPQLERVLKIKITAKIIDTLWLSWYLYPDRQLHGLEWWGKDLGIAKPLVTDWSEQPLEVYINRCTEDVKINLLLWKKQLKYLGQLYVSEEPEKLPIISYLMFKASCAREQERSKWKLDKAWCEEALERLSAEQQPKVDNLKGVMPNVSKYQMKSPPAKPFKKDGTLSVEGAKWQKNLSDLGLTKDHSLPISVKIREEPPNPNSPEQIKDWLYSLGWEPMTFKFIKEEDGSERKIPQIKIPNSPDICPSVLALAEEEPAINELAGLSVLKHRIGILKGFLESMDEEGFVKARVQGLTNTLRFKHTGVVNLPGVDKPYGVEIRGCLIARDGNELVGSDMVALENKTGDHYIYALDPAFVEKKGTPGYDSHTEMAVIAELITEEEEEFYKWYKGKK